MGTTYTVKLVGPVSDRVQADVTEAIEESLAAVDVAMSTYRQDSELSHFNRLPAAATPMNLSPEVRTVLQIAFDVHTRSGGALDITVGPLVRLWGFGPDKRTAVPTAQEQARIVPLVGMDKLHMDSRGLTKRVDGVQCDLSAVAKGFAVDQVAAALQRLGVHNFLVEVGGELKARGHRPDGTPFRVGIERPVPTERSIAEVIELRDSSMATSGDYRNFIEDDGRRVSHIIDPRTGQPTEHHLASVTVVEKRAAVADAWATALSVLGPDEGPKVAEAEGLAAFFIVRDSEDRFRSQATTAFTRLRSPTKP